MKIKILRVSINELVEAIIRKGDLEELPSIHTGWRFNFDKHARKLSYARAYVLVCEDTPELIEGCMIFQMKDKTIPYMAFLEVAPHNKGANKKHDHVAGCLIAHACKISLKEAKGDYIGALVFDVMERLEEDQQKLMKLYTEKYHANAVDNHTMIILPEAAAALINEYLNN
ncbi:hypothetical protein HHL16_07265 [Pseudoflavitalea sp. G-6-1-2]|uniref:hypothetical protein n=1 Tax=Pseudoflavitalea sp. G-6-1-2 TaxID=2728841 RepID=UPI00146F018B|nr:hypothetical protein [Pseudoflavitalea sp. G-6-1-2]NML20667.1 hypothetical protein [Pseudoflavitalea sp. G-6-1-2]